MDKLTFQEALDVVYAEVMASSASDYDKKLMVYHLRHMDEVVRQVPARRLTLPSSGLVFGRACR